MNCVALCLTKLYSPWLHWSSTLTAIQIWTPPYSFNFGLKYNTFILWDCRVISTIKMRKETGSTTWFMYSHSFEPISDIFFFICFFVQLLLQWLLLLKSWKTMGLLLKRVRYYILFFWKCLPSPHLSNYWKIKLHSDGIFSQKSWHQQLTLKMILEEDPSRRPR